MYRFDSDYMEGCHPSILKRMEETNFDQAAGYGNDCWCDNAKRMIREFCGNPDADIHFLVGGTQVNAAVITALLKPYQGVLSSDCGHINVHETGAVEHNGHKVLALPSNNGKITAAQLDKAIKEHWSLGNREHVVMPGMVYLTFPTEYGTIYSRAELRDIYAVCKKADLPLYIDGARLGYGLAGVGCDIDIRDLSTLCDAFTIGGTKQGAMMGEALVFNNVALSKDFRYAIKMSGAMLAKGRFLGIQFETLMQDDLYMKLSRSAVKKAQRIKDAFVSKGYTMLMESPTNQQFPVISNEIIRELREKFSFEIWENVDSEHTAVRFCTSWATTEEATEELINYISSSF